MADHSELIMEMVQMDKMTTQERLKLAKRKRMQQLKKWSQREKEYNNPKRKKDQIVAKNVKKHDYKVHFVPSVMLLEAAARNDVEEVKRLLMLGVSPDSNNEDGLTALHQCCIDDSEEMMKLLLEFGADVDAKDSEQWTPLHAAATCGHLHIVKYLISKDADLLAVNADGNMPYDICNDDVTLDYIENEMANRGVTQEMIDETRAATENQMLKDLKALAKDNKDLEFCDNNGATPIHIAAANGYLTVIEFLLDNHVAVDVCDIDQWQPIHAAACWGHPDALELLVQAGADLNAKTKNGEIPYDISGDIEVKERIMQLKYELETKRTQGDKLKRSQNQNTRSQSIRRTSIREKAQISRREAREEARIRQEKEEHDSLCDEEESKQHLDTLMKEYAEIPEIDVHDINISFLPQGAKDTLQRFKAKTSHDILERKDSTCKTNSKLPASFCGNDVPNGDSVKDDLSLQNPDVAKGTTPNFIDGEKRSLSAAGDTAMTVTQITNIPQASEALTFVQQNSGQSVNVEIHVTVNTSPAFATGQGTLSDLKKQRCDQRHRSSVSSDSSPQETRAQNGHLNKGCDYDNPPSPTVAPRKFVGNPLEMVGEKRKKSRCCILI